MLGADPAAPAREIFASRVPAHVLGLVAALAAMASLLIGAMVWQQRAVQALELRANEFHRASITASADALEALAAAENRLLRARDPGAATASPYPGVQAELAWREVRSLGYHALERLQVLVATQARWGDAAFAATVARLEAGRAAFAAELGTLRGLDAAADALFGEGSREMRFALDQLRILHDEAYQATLARVQQRQEAGLRLVLALAGAVLLAGGVVVWRMLRLIRADIAGQQALQRELGDSLRMLSEAQSGGRVGLWRVDYTIGVLDASPEAWEVVRLPPPLRTLEGLRASIHPEDRPEFNLQVARALTEGVAIEVRYRIVDAQGETRFFRASAAPVARDGEGRVLQLGGVVQDITGQMRAELELEAYRRDLERIVESRTAELTAVNRELEAFSYSVSHDLRGPLRGIDGFSQALLEEYGEALDEDGRDYLRRVRAGVQRMGRLIDDLLNLSRVSRVELQRQPVDLSALARAVDEELARHYPEGSHTVLIEEGMQAYGDRGLLQVLLENLLGNARKFSARVTAPSVRFGSGEHDGETVYTVSDNGAGFDMRFADKLFGAFQRLHDAKDFDGTGIGLATVQRVVNRHGGRVWAEGKPGAGAAFHFTLAVRRAGEAAPGPSGERRAPKGN